MDDVKEGAKQLSIGCLATIIVLVFVFGGGLAFAYFGIIAQRTVLNPEVRQNKVRDPNASIANKAAFHSDINFIVSLDNNLITLLQKRQNDKPGSSAYDDDSNQILQQEQLRNAAIGTYNKDATNPDKMPDLDKGMPEFISPSALPGDDTQAISDLLNEVNELQPHPTPSN